MACLLDILTYRNFAIIIEICKTTFYIRLNLINLTRMWANAQHDGRPAEYRWRPLFNAAKFGYCPLLKCRAVTLPRSESRLNLQECPKLVNRSQPLVGRSSPYCKDMWRKYCCLTFFPIADKCHICEDIARQSCAMVPRCRIFGDFLGRAFPASRVQHFKTCNQNSY